jgi:hypothetical protein
MKWRRSAAGKATPALHAENRQVEINRWEGTVTADTNAGISGGRRVWRLVEGGMDTGAP